MPSLDVSRIFAPNGLIGWIPRLLMAAAVSLVMPITARAQSPADSLRIQIMARRAAAAGRTTPGPAAASKPVIAAAPARTKPVAKARIPVVQIPRIQAPMAAAVVVDTILTLVPADAKRDSARVPAPTVVAALPASAPAPTPAAPTVSGKATAAPAAAILTGATLSGLLQAWYSAGSAGMEQSFRVRRAEIKLAGRAAEHVTYTMMVDVAKSLSTNNTYVEVNGVRVLKDESVNQASRMLQDAFLTITLPRAVTLDVGQFRLPLSYEGTLSASKLDAIDRALFLTDRARNAGYGDIRDIGVMARGTVSKRVDWFVGLFNGLGESQNSTDRNRQKVKVARVVYRPDSPSLKGLQLGASAAHGGKPQADAPRRDRLGGEVQLQRGRLLLRSEGMTGIDGSTHRAGGYLHAGWKVRRAVELFGRVDMWDPNTAQETALSSGLGRDLVAGSTWLLAGNTKMQFEFVKHDFSHHFAPGTRQVLVNVQAAW